jgi:mono/diheme cytochrome c family protein
MMKRPGVLVRPVVAGALCLALGLSLLPSALAQGQEKPQSGAVGAYLYRTYCSNCHGASGKGDGPMADRLKFLPADLTLISKRNGGTYPFDKVVQIIDGRNPLKGHGGPEMPIWGDAFKNSRDGYDDAKVKEKITQLAHYLETLQSH